MTTKDKFKDELFTERVANKKGKLEKGASIHLA